MTTRDSWIDKEEFQDLARPLLPPKKPEKKRAASRKSDEARKPRSADKASARPFTADSLEERILKESEGLPFGEPEILKEEEAPYVPDVQDRDEEAGTTDPSPESEDLPGSSPGIAEDEPGSADVPAGTAEDDPGSADVPVGTAEEEPVDREQEQGAPAGAQEMSAGWSEAEPREERKEPPPEKPISLPEMEATAPEATETEEAEEPAHFPSEESERAMKSLASAREAADRSKLIRKAAVERILGEEEGDADTPLPQPDFSRAEGLADRMTAYAALIESEVGAQTITIRDESGHPIFIGAEAANQLGATASLRRDLARRYREVPFPSAGQHFVSQIRLEEGRWLCLLEAPDAAAAGGAMIEMVVPAPLPASRAEQLARMLAATLRPGWAA